MIRKFAITVAAFGSIGLFAGALSAMPTGSWEIGPWVRGQNYSIGMQDAPRVGRDGSLSVDFPRHGRGEWDALTTRIGPLSGTRTITVRYRIDAKPGTRFVAVETPREAATVSLYFQRAGDNWSARGPYESYRWYAPRETVMPLTPGTHTITVKIDEKWKNVMGKPADQRARGFRSALDNTARLGLAFGSHSRRSHGVAATGPARFTLLSVRLD